MRQTMRFAGLLSLLLFSVSSLAAEPIIHGFFIERLPKGKAKATIAPGKSLVLAHIFNSDNKAIKPGAYNIGVEIENNGKKKMFALKPNTTINSKRMKTFRMAVPISDSEKQSGYFRVFSKVEGKTVWSEKYSFLQGIHAKGENGITTLYTEVPPEAGTVVPPTEIQFENSKRKTVAKNVEKVTAKTTKTVAKAVSSIPVVPTTEKLNVASAKSSDKVVSKLNTEVSKTEKAARTIDSSEFKKLRTIDEELVIYVIKEGDTLKSIATKYYGNPNRERVVADLNFIENPSSIKVGEEIIIDVKPLGKETYKTSSTITPSSSASAETYTIKPGDTLGKIAKQLLGRSSKAGLLIKANPHLDPRNLKIGTTIVVPENKGDNA